MTLPLRIDRTGGTGKVQEFNPTSEQLDVRVLPSELPCDWDTEFPVGHVFQPGDQVWYLGRLFACNTQDTKGTVTPIDDNNWDNVGGNLTLAEVGGRNPESNITEMRLQLNTAATTGSNIGLTKTLSGGIGTYSINLDPSDFVAQGSGFSTAGVGLTSPTDGTVSLDLYPQKVMLFLGATEGTEGTTSEVIDGSTRTYLTFTTNGTAYYFIRGINITAGAFADGGAGVWTTDDPTGPVTVANSADLIG